MKDNTIYAIYNPFFIIPFLVWFFTGGALLSYYNKDVLFSSINGRYNSYGDAAMYYITYMGEGFVIIPTLLLLPLVIKTLRTRAYFVAALIANIGTFLLAQGLKSYFNDPRPLTYFKGTIVHIAENWDHHYHRSFPSGHTSAAFAFFCFLSLLLSNKYKAWGVLFFCLALLVGYSRIYLAAHFFLDVYVGSILGTVFSIFAVSIFYKAPIAKN